MEKLLNNEGNETTALRSANESLEIQVIFRSCFTIMIIFSNNNKLHEMEEAVLSAKKRADDAEFEVSSLASYMNFL